MIHPCNGNGCFLRDRCARFTEPTTISSTPYLGPRDVRVVMMCVAFVLAKKEVDNAE